MVESEALPLDSMPTEVLLEPGQDDIGKSIAADRAGAKVPPIMSLRWPSNRVIFLGTISLFELKFRSSLVRLSVHSDDVVCFMDIGQLAIS